MRIRIKATKQLVKVDHKSILSAVNQLQSFMSVNYNQMQYRPIQDSFLELVNQFLSLNQGQAQKSTIDAINNQLQDFVRKPGFLELALRLLQSQTFTKDQLVLITNLLKNKLKYEFDSVQQSHLAIYYNELCSIAKLIQCHSQAAFTNISLALAFIYIHLLAVSDQSFQSFLAPFVPSESIDPQIYNYYFKVLEYIASEIDNSHLVIDEQARFQAKRRAIQQQQAVLIILNQNSNKAWQMNKVQRQNILQCFTCWVDLGYNEQVLNSLPSHCLLPLMFSSLQSDGQVNSAVECLKIIINLIKNSEQNGPIFKYLASNIMQLMKVVDKLVKDYSMIDAEQYLTIILDFSRKSSRLLLQEIQNTIHFLQQLVQYTGNKEMSNYQNFCGMWEIMLTEAIAQQNQGDLDPAFFSILPHLYNSLCLQCKYSQTIIVELNSRSEKKVFEDTRFNDEVLARRQQTAPLFDKMSRLQGKCIFLEMVIAKIRVLISRNQQTIWSQLQVCLLSLIIPLRKFETVNENVIFLINSFIQLGEGQTSAAPVAIKRAFLRIFRSLMSVMDKNTQFIQRLFYLTSTCFSNPLLMDAAEKTFAKGCEDNAKTLQGSLGEMMNILQAYPHCANIVSGVFTLILNSNQDIPVYLPFALTLLYNTIIDQKATKQHKKDSMHALIAASKILKDHPNSQRYLSLVQNFTTEIWEWFKFGLSHPQMLHDDQDPQIQRLVKLMKNIMRCLGLEFKEFIPPLLETLSSTYQQYPICSYVYLVEVAVTVFCGHSDFAQYFKGVYIRFCELTYLHLNSREKIERYHFLLDDFIGMNKRFFMFNANIVLTSGQLPALLDLCIFAFMSSGTPRVAKACYSFFESIFMVYWREEFIEEYNAETEGDKFVPRPEDHELHKLLRTFLYQKIEHILLKMLQHLSEVPVELTRECILDALMSQLKAFPLVNPCIWANVLGSLGPDILVEVEKERFKQLLVSSQSNDFRECQQAIKGIQRSLILINRRMMNTNKRSKLSI